MIKNKQYLYYIYKNPDDFSPRLYLAGVQGRRISGGYPLCADCRRHPVDAILAKERRSILAPYKFGVALLVKLLLVLAQQELPSKNAQPTWCRASRQTPACASTAGAFLKERANDGVKGHNLTLL